MALFFLYIHLFSLYQYQAEFPSRVFPNVMLRSVSCSHYLPGAAFVFHAAQPHTLCTEPLLRDRTHDQFKSRLADIRQFCVTSVLYLHISFCFIYTVIVSQSRPTVWPGSIEHILVKHVVRHNSSDRYSSQHSITTSRSESILKMCLMFMFLERIEISQSEHHSCNIPFENLILFNGLHGIWKH